MYVVSREGYVREAIEYREGSEMAEEVAGEDSSLHPI
jgi:hypothetical protein